MLVDALASPRLDALRSHNSRNGVRAYPRQCTDALRAARRRRFGRGTRQNVSSTYAPAQNGPTNQLRAATARHGAMRRGRCRA